MSPRKKCSIAEPSAKSTRTSAAGSGTIMKSPAVPNGVSQIGPNGDIIRLLPVQPTPLTSRSGSSRAGNPLPRARPEMSQVETKISSSRSMPFLRSPPPPPPPPAPAAGGGGGGGGGGQERRRFVGRPPHPPHRQAMGPLPLRPWRRRGNSAPPESFRAHPADCRSIRDARSELHDRRGVPGLRRERRHLPPGRCAVRRPLRSRASARDRRNRRRIVRSGVVAASDVQS